MLVALKLKKIYDKGFILKDILSDYREIVVDYDKTINDLSDKVISADKNMLRGVILLLVSELLLKIIVSI